MAWDIHTIATDVCLGLGAAINGKRLSATAIRDLRLIFARSIADLPQAEPTGIKA
jgi:hypothetical protein